MGIRFNRERCEYTVECDFCKKSRKVYDLNGKTIREVSKIIDADGWNFRRITKIVCRVLFPDITIVLCRACSKKKRNKATFFKKVSRVDNKQAMVGFTD